MMKEIRVVTILSFWRKVVWTILVIYSVSITVLLLKLKPEPILIGVDSFGTRIIRTADDQLIKQEKENFLKRFLHIYNNYNSENYQQTISEAGDLMSKDFWEKKQPEFQRIAQGLKKESITQSSRIEDIREIDFDTFQIDLLISVKDKLKDSKLKVRVDLKLKTGRRSAQNPYPYEVESYEEQIVL